MDGRLAISGGYSQGVRRVLTRLVVLLPYAKASELADELAGIWVSDSSLWELVQNAGATMQTQSAWQPVTSQKQTSVDCERMGMALDGCMMNIRQEGWKEAKLGTVFEVKNGEMPSKSAIPAEQVGAPEPLTDPTNYVDCVQQSCVIHLGGPEGLSNQLFAEARARRFSQAAQYCVIGDGADWIWNIAATDYPAAAQINDWYHAGQHLHAAANLLYPAEPAHSAIWVDYHKQVLFGGGADLVADAIHTAASLSRQGAQRAALETEAGYFNKRHDRMQYADFRDAGLPIGSGVVEALAKQVKHRMSAAGMRWSRSGATNLLPFLAAELSGTFNPYWHRLHLHP
jgi:hypothetical protein